MSWRRCLNAVEMTYETPKVVQVTDNTLGIVFWFLRLGIFLQVVLVFILIDKKYLLCEPVDTNSDIGIVTWSALSNDECAELGRPRTWGIVDESTDYALNYPLNGVDYCNHTWNGGRNGALISSLCAPHEMVFAATSKKLRLTLSHYHKDKNPADDGTFREYYEFTKALEDNMVTYIARVKAVFHGSSDEIIGDIWNTEYRVVDQNGDVIDGCLGHGTVHFDPVDTCLSEPPSMPCTFKPGDFTYMPMRVLLKSAGIEDLDAPISPELVKGCVEQYTTGRLVTRPTLDTLKTLKSNSDFHSIHGSSPSAKAFTLTDDYDSFRTQAEEYCTTLTYRMAGFSVLLTFKYDNMKGITS
ncbi:hypothetical protein CYMTET_56385 [Cymbomonas tetramitiformis]|uniref:Uncharacterized protein n=1 Tax=Cymbomonas tetramitiformis TaxID=36881 RepID=A0AAE0ELV7_9CHLO|nr:hypothetical protein CYMTET_56385 [Cymbomonas tetramitiformis]